MGYRIDIDAVVNKYMLKVPEQYPWKSRLGQEKEFESNTDFEECSTELLNIPTTTHDFDNLIAKYGYLR